MKNLLLALLFLLPTTGWCHSKVVTTEPANETILDKPPVVVKIIFNKAIEPHFNQAELNINEQWVTLNSSVKDKTLMIPLENTDLKQYQIRWSVISLDGHRERGLLKFSIK
ncbi:MAG TPA: copper resistance CopC family protein [Methylotenera sp.]|nr:copper resistance CopC family protein [Methylotenera sp.]